MPIIAFQASYKMQADRLVEDGYVHVRDGRDRFEKECGNETTIVILHYNTTRRSWEPISHRIVKAD